MAEDNEMEKVWLELAEQYKIDELVKFSEFNIQDKLAENSWQVTKFTELYEKESDKLNQILALKDRVTGERYDHYRFNFDKELKQSEIEKYYLPKDEKIIKLNNIIRKQTYRVNFFAMAVKALEKMQWNMKSFWDIVRMGR
jgi:hypothetical protein